MYNIIYNSINSSTGILNFLHYFQRVFPIFNFSSIFSIFSKVEFGNFGLKFFVSYLNRDTKSEYERVKMDEIPHPFFM